MKIKDTINYINEYGLECDAILFDDGSVAITGSENYIIEDSNNALLKAEEILTNIGYKKLADREKNSRANQ